jgi:hypothetical protein
MKKLIAAAVVILLALAGTGAAYWAGWLDGIVPVSKRAGAPAASPAGASVPGAGPESGVVSAGAAGGAPQPGEALPAFDGNIAAVDWGGTMESIKGVEKESQYFLSRLLRGSSYGTSELEDGPQEFVISFFDREAALIDRVEVIGVDDPTPAHAPRDVEVWTSMTSPSSGFSKVASATLPKEGSGAIRFDAVEARFVKIRILAAQDGDGRNIQLTWLKVFEAQRSGYVPLLTRRQDILGPLASGGAASTPVEALPTSPACEPVRSEPPPPGRDQSRKVLVLSDSPWTSEPRNVYPGFRLKEEDLQSRAARSPDLSIFDRIEFVLTPTAMARPYHLSEKNGFDTVVMEQVCSDNYPLSPSFKKALIAWVAAGHKLIIHDADKCAPGPDYGWLPYRLKTDNPGAQGAAGDSLKIVEENWMVHNRKGRPGFIDAAAWVAGAELYKNELGDSNTVVEWDARWCGHLVVRNVAGVFGFAEAYAHVGRGLVVYNGFDVDMVETTGYDVLIARELAQGFDPDNLPCSARIGSFVLTTDPPFYYQPLVPGRSVTYPLTLLSNQRYKGNVTLSVGSSPVVPGLQARFDPATVAVSDLHQATMTLTVPATAAVRAAAVEVKGTDPDGKVNSLCLQIGPPRTGELHVVSALRPPSRTGKNVEIILDASGSMKAPLQRKRSRWDVALETLRLVLEKLPDDFNVGLRMYGHRESSRSPRTCTDTELLAPVAPIDRAGILERARAFKPKGETPLVYSALQAPGDLKALGGGTVILITDGEESCRGDAVKAAAELKASGLDVRLNIVGFALSSARGQKQLGEFAQSTGGRFYAADDGPALAEALLMAAIEKFPFTIYDAAGKAVAQGEAGGAPEQLPPGEYKVVVRAGGQELVASRVRVALGEISKVTIAFDKDRLVLQ